MRTPRSKPNSSRPLSQIFHHRFVSYASAAAAAGTGLFGLAQPAEAQIVYTPAHVALGDRSSYALDLTHNGRTDFVIRDSLTGNFSSVFNRLMVKPVLANAVEGSIYQDFSQAKALPAGARIGPSQSFFRHGFRNGVLMGEAINSQGGGYLVGNWLHVADRYLGLKFRINGQIHYGWARLTVALALNKPLTAALDGYAYETRPNVPIIAGEEHSGAGAALIEPAIGTEHDSGSATIGPNSARPATLWMLALGAPGLALWR